MNLIEQAEQAVQRAQRLGFELEANNLIQDKLIETSQLIRKRMGFDQLVMEDYI